MRRPDKWGGLALVASVLATGIAVFLQELAEDVDGPTAFVGAVGLLFLTLGMVGLRNIVTKNGLPGLLGASALGILAMIVGSTVKISGVLLTIPVAAAALYTVARSPWRIGDSAIFCLLVTFGAAAGYVLAAQLDPNTGSQTDQAAGALAALGVILTVAAVALIRALPRSPRIALVLACLLSIPLALGAGGNTNTLVLWAPVGFLWAAGWIWIGLKLVTARNILGTAQAVERSSPSVANP